MKNPLPVSWEGALIVSYWWQGLLGLTLCNGSLIVRRDELLERARSLAGSCCILFELRVVSSGELPKEANHFLVDLLL